MTERDPKTGRFLPGHSGGPGRPKRKTEAEYLEAMHDDKSLDEWRKATVKMRKLAMAGDVQAYKVIAPYYVGLPVQKLQISSADAAVLSDLLAVLDKHNISAGEMFQAMIEEIDSMAQEADENAA